MLPIAVKAACEEKLGAPISRASFIGGGDINEARLLETRQGPFFLKLNSKPGAIRMFEKEEAGLGLLRKSEAIRVPESLGTGEAENYGFLILEYIEETGRSRQFWENFGQALAQLHRKTDNQFGLNHSNYIGSLLQSNQRHGSWSEFYVLERLEPQASMAITGNGLWPGAAQDFEKLYKRIEELCPEEPPSLTHGDLWSGNFISAPGPTPVLIDPAVSYAHREMDLAMSQLFGGFSPDFYRSYEETYPTQPGLEERIDIYQLYYLLVHVNLFGRGYARSVQKILERYT